VTLVDSNVLIDLVTDDPVWARWSQDRLESAALSGPVHINDVVYAEVSAGYSTIERFEAVLAEAQLTVDPIPREALFRAGKAFQAYRRAGGPRTGVLPDFFIGAHAAARGWPLLTRDARRYRAYFPGLEIISPA
jgi:predicted nucleic acid-binding protein